MTGNISPKDRFVTVYGRKPVLEALSDYSLRVDKVVIAEGTRGPAIEEIREMAADRAVPVQHASAHRVKVLSGNGRHDQGGCGRGRPPNASPVTLRIPSGPRRPAAGWFDHTGERRHDLANRHRGGNGQIVVPHRRSPARPARSETSAGVAFHAPVLRTRTAGDAAELLTEAGYRCTRWRRTPRRASSPLNCPPARCSCSAAKPPACRTTSAPRFAVDLHPDARRRESINVASAAAVVCFELLRRKTAQ